MEAPRRPLALLILLCAAAAAVAHAPAPEQHDDGQVDCTSDEVDEYNLGLAVASVFILLAVSLVGSTAPMALSRAKCGTVNTLIKVGTFAGSGVVLATALIHVLLPANEYLTNECLPDFWHRYEAWAFMFCTATIIVFQIVDYGMDSLVDRYAARREREAHHTHTHHAHGHAHPEAHTHPEDQQQSGPGAAGSSDEAPCAKHGNCSDLECGGRALLAAHSAAQRGQLDLPTALRLALAELAIVFHSIIIGLALGVTPADQFNTLLIALCFHQFLEGFALGSAVVEAGFGALKAALLAISYSLSTPLGIAIGIAVRQSFNHNATATLLTQGILDSICAGVLIYVGLSGPMNATKASAGWLRQQGHLVHVACFAALAGGAASMAVIGKWA